SSDECSSALDGMQPTLRQVPPSVARFSTHATFNPSCAALIAHTYPPGPDPMMMTSKESLMAWAFALSLRQYHGQNGIVARGRAIVMSCRLMVMTGRHIVVT